MPNAKRPSRTDFAEDETCEEGALLRERVAALIDVHGLSQRDLASKAAVAQKTVSNLLSGTNVPNLQSCSKLARALGVPLWKLIKPR